MKNALVAALAALSATAWMAPDAHAQRGEDRGRSERGDDDRGRRGDGERNRGDGQRQRGDGERNRGGGERNRGDAQRQRGDGGDELLGGQRQWRGGAQDGETRRRGEWRGADARDRAQPPVTGQRREGGQHEAPAAQRGDGQRGDWNRDGRRDGDGQRGDWNRDGRRDGDGQRGDWNRDGRRDGDGQRGDWNRDGRRTDWGRSDRGDWDRDSRDWERRRADRRYDRWRHTHRDFERPRYRDWRHVRHGYYFDHGYARIVGGYWGRSYYWWSYDGWRRPHRRYVVGYYLPDYIYWEPLPWDLYYMLPPAPYGCRYVMVDGDILLIVASTGLILDALLYY